MKHCCLALTAAALLIGTGAAGLCAVDLEWRPAYQVVHTGDVLRIGLYAVSDSGSSHAISGLDAIMLYDQSSLDFRNLIAEGEPYDWLVDGFLWPSPDNLNDSLDDGSMYYTAWAQLGVPAYATPEGLLVTTLEFIGGAPLCRSVVSIPLSLGSAVTRVLDGTVPNNNVVGQCGTARVMVVEPGVLTSVGQVKQQPDEAGCEVGGPIVTRSFASFFYLEDYSRAAGIRVNCDPSQVPAEGSTPRVSGVVRTINGERVIDQATVTGCGEEAVPAPFGMNSTAPMMALNPQGLLVKLWGYASVPDPQASEFILSDGSPYAMRVELHGVTPPGDGDYVAVTGALGADAGGPVLRVNNAGDMTLIAH